MGDPVERGISLFFLIPHTFGQLSALMVMGSGTVGVRGCGFGYRYRRVAGCWDRYPYQLLAAMRVCFHLGSDTVGVG